MGARIVAETEGRIQLTPEEKVEQNASDLNPICFFAAADSS